MLSLKLARAIANSLLLGCLTLTPQFSAAQKAGGMIVVFGTSLSDPGNAFAVLGATTPPDWSVDPFLVPDRPYARGGHHFSNGMTWVEQYARPIGLGASVKPAFAGTGGTNFAFGGARARALGPSPHLAQQVGAFLQATRGVAPGHALYVIEMGGNDMRDALQAFAMGQGAVGAQMLTDALAAMRGNIELLYGAGARTFLVWNMPNIGATPAIRPTPLAGIANMLALDYNVRLESQVLGPLSALPDIRIVRFDIYGKLNGVIESPATFGLTNVTEACLALSAPFACAHPNDYLFWDGIHPSAAGHGVIAHQAAALLN
jgi:phospholipase/lecithinase/hemolysin